MNEYVLERNRKLAAKVIKGLESRNMEGYFAETREDALAKALELIPKGASVNWGGGFSAEEIGLKKAILDGDYEVVNRDVANTKEEKRAAELAAYSADYFIASTNAISEDGVLINVDGHANRVSAIACGPENVLFIVGMNKVAKDFDAAMARARGTAGPMNAQRFPIKTPCKELGACMDCKSPDTICCQILITRFSQVKGRIKVILVNDVLGF